MEYLYSEDWQDIDGFNSRSTCAYIEVRIADVLHTFMFRTLEGKDIDIYKALQTHSNNYYKAKLAKVMNRKSKVRVATCVTA